MVIQIIRDTFETPPSQCHIWWHYPNFIVVFYLKPTFSYFLILSRLLLKFLNFHCAFYCFFILKHISHTFLTLIPLSLLFLAFPIFSTLSQLFGHFFILSQLSAYFLNFFRALPHILSHFRALSHNLALFSLLSQISAYLLYF